MTTFPVFLPVNSDWNARGHASTPSKWVSWTAILPEDTKFRKLIVTQHRSAGTHNQRPMSIGQHSNNVTPSQSQSQSQHVTVTTSDCKHQSAPDEHGHEIEHIARRAGVGWQKAERKDARFGQDDVEVPVPSSIQRFLKK